MTETVAAPRPHHSGHRQRLRDRLLTAGPDALQDYEILELLLFLAVPRRDVKPMAKDLLGHFGGLGAVLHASPDELNAFPGMTDSVCGALKTVQAATQRIARNAVVKQPVLSSWTGVLDYLHTTMSHEKREQLRLLLLDGKNRLITDHVLHQGTVNHTPAYPREIVRKALEVGATAVILVHNHPSGDPTPSKDDIRMTQKICDAARPLGLHIHDHVIIGRDGHASLKNMGLM